LSVIAEEAGEFLFEVHALFEPAIPVCYRVEVDAPRPASPLDRKQILTEHKFVEADRLRLEEREVSSR
jgi:hypothetical protein